MSAGRPTGISLTKSIILLLVNQSTIFPKLPIRPRVLIMSYPFVSVSAGMLLRDGRVILVDPIELFAFLDFGVGDGFGFEAVMHGFLLLLNYMYNSIQLLINTLTHPRHLGIHTQMDRQSNNADIEYLISMFEEDLDLLREYGARPEIDPVTKTYLDGFIGHVQENRHTQNSDATDFIDYGTKLMAYLSKNGVKGVEISNGAMDSIVHMLVDPLLLREPLLQEIENKKKANNHQDAEALVQVLAELDRKPVDVAKFMEKLGKVSGL